MEGILNFKLVGSVFFYSLNRSKIFINIFIKILDLRRLQFEDEIKKLRI